MTYLSNDFFFVLYVNPFLNVKRVYRSISKLKLVVILIYKRTIEFNTTIEREKHKKERGTRPIKIVRNDLVVKNDLII